MVVQLERVGTAVQQSTPADMCPELAQAQAQDFVHWELRRNAYDSRDRLPTLSHLGQQLTGGAGGGGAAQQQEQGGQGGPSCHATTVQTTALPGAGVLSCLPYRRGGAAALRHRPAAQVTSPVGGAAWEANARACLQGCAGTLPLPGRCLALLCAR